MPTAPPKPEDPFANHGTIGEIFSGAKSLSSSPLGIIALFIVLIYGIAGLVLSVSVTNLGETKLIFVWFLVGFPVLVFFMFSYLVINHHEKLYGPSDFTDQKNFIDILDRLKKAEKTVDIYKEVSNVAAVDLSVKRTQDVLSTMNELLHTTPIINVDDPQKGRWGGERQNKTRKISVGTIESLKRDGDFFRVPLRVESTDTSKPVTGDVKFFLHPTFHPSVIVVQPVDGVATLELVAYGAFTVGVETDDGGKLEIDLSDPDIAAPSKFKEN